MTLFLMRHGDAEYPTGTGSDSKRRLTDWGRMEVESAAAAMKRAQCVPEIMISSPFVRAMETAQIMARGLGVEKTGSSNRLSPAADNDDMMDVVKENKNAESLLLIGHMPSMGTFAGSLIAQGCALEMSTASIVALRLDGLHGAMQGALLWFMNSQIAGMGRS